MSPSRYFSQSYAEARGKFLSAARAAGLDVQGHVHPLLGRDGELLAIDVARFGAADAEALLILSSACHGVEGFAGSGVQVALLADPAFHALAEASGVAVLYVHGVNPWGFSWWRRWTHENVDLNRNFVDFDGGPLPENPGYDELAQALVPPTWPSPESDAVLWAYYARHGARATQIAISGGQFRHPDGLYFVGTGPTWSHRAVRKLLREHGRACRRLAWIDLHTATGALGECEYMFSSRFDAAALARAKAWWGDGVACAQDGSASLSLPDGVMVGAANAECPQAEVIGIVLEFGTVPHETTLTAVRADQWLQRQTQVDQSVRQDIERRVRDVFYVDTDAWKASTAAQGREAAFKAVAGLRTA